MYTSFHLANHTCTYTHTRMHICIHIRTYIHTDPLLSPGCTVQSGCTWVQMPATSTLQMWRNSSSLATGYAGRTQLMCKIVWFMFYYYNHPTIKLKPCFIAQCLTLRIGNHRHKEAKSLILMEQDISYLNKTRPSNRPIHSKVLLAAILSRLAAFCRHDE